MLRLDDEELRELLALSAPIPRQLRPAFLEAVAAQLAGREQAGAGRIYRIGREVQRAFLSHGSPARGPTLTGFGPKRSV
jgi:hypothetical protein